MGLTSNFSEDTSEDFVRYHSHLPSSRPNPHYFLPAS